MGSKLALEDNGRVTSLRRRQSHDCIDARHSKQCSCSSMLSPQQQGPKGKEKMTEFLCSCCFLCVCCPLATVSCLIKQPCRICQQAMRRAWRWACYGTKNKVYADYSSFSDIDSDVTYGYKVKPRVFLKTK